MAAKAVIKSLYYITHVANVPSILKRGIYSHDDVAAQQFDYTPIYDTTIIGRRREIAAPNGQRLGEYANLFFQPRNAMLYRVLHEKNIDDIAVVAVKPNVLQLPGAYVTDGNAAHGNTMFYPPDQGLDVIGRQQAVMDAEYWNDLDGSKRKMMAECIVTHRVAPEYVHSIFVGKESVKTKLGFLPVEVLLEPRMFFRPHFAKLIGKNISLLRGDMFFSGMQTLTISVNLQGIMGKGLASRAKYQFPDVYVAYQDMCRSKTVTATKPGLYKREASLDLELADQTFSPLATPNAAKWFMLFATKRRWQESSRLDDIAAGLDWFRKNFERERISSVAFPALGCGLGGLPWSSVGPLMCQSLHDIGIQVCIYLPQAENSPEAQLTQEFLLPGV